MSTNFSLRLYIRICYVIQVYDDPCISSLGARNEYGVADTLSILWKTRPTCSDRGHYTRHCTCLRRVRIDQILRSAIKVNDIATLASLNLVRFFVMF